MTVTFDVSMNAKELFKFSMNNTYRKVTGILWILFSIGAAFITVYTWGDVDISRSILMIVLASLFTVVNPLLTWMRVKLQVKTNKSFAKPLSYTVDENGITVSQDELSDSIKWDEIWKAVKYGKQIVVYITTVRAFIFPVNCVGEQYDALVTLLDKGLANRNHIKGKK
jgi:hypothetical protein